MDLTTVIKEKFNDLTTSDLTLRVDNELYYVHRYILQWTSGYFRDKLATPKRGPSISKLYSEKRFTQKLERLCDYGSQELFAITYLAYTFQVKELKDSCDLFNTKSFIGLDHIQLAIGCDEKRDLAIEDISDLHYILVGVLAIRKKESLQKLSERNSHTNRATETTSKIVMKLSQKPIEMQN
ncbi:9663_t:CDS:2 [Ambispora leptoticha]|uniref:9663_t:CDS:1 n=1 Tax=Ambispora leptoticha TaxID=144679 RepID=A0A9N8V8I0_9GLOM|nr:9663_t:CDS:2 [Ambispora leptoticha]